MITSVPVGGVSGTSHGAGLVGSVLQPTFRVWRRQWLLFRWFRDMTFHIHMLGKCVNTHQRNKSLVGVQVGQRSNHVHCVSSLSV